MTDIINKNVIQKHNQYQTEIKHSLITSDS